MVGAEAEEAVEHSANNMTHKKRPKKQLRTVQIIRRYIQYEFRFNTPFSIEYVMQRGTTKYQHCGKLNSCKVCSKNAETKDEINRGVAHVFGGRPVT